MATRCQLEGVVADTQMQEVACSSCGNNEQDDILCYYSDTNKIILFVGVCVKVEWFGILQLYDELAVLDKVSTFIL